MARAERRQTRNHPQRREGNGRRQGEPRRVRDAARGLRRRGERDQRGGHVAVERDPRRRQRQRAMPAHEEGDAERLLERLHLPRERRLRDEELLRGARERQVPAGGLEAPEEVERRQLPQRLLHAPTSCKSFAKTV